MTTDTSTVSPMHHSSRPGAHVGLCGRHGVQSRDKRSDLHDLPVTFQGHHHQWHLLSIRQDRRPLVGFLLPLLPRDSWPDAEGDGDKGLPITSSFSSPTQAQNEDIIIDLAPGPITRARAKKIHDQFEEGEEELSQVIQEEMLPSTRREVQENMKATLEHQEMYTYAYETWNLKPKGKHPAMHDFWFSTKGKQ